MSDKVEPKIVLNDRHIGAGTDPSRGLPALHLDSLRALGIEAPDQRYILAPETARKVGVQLVLAADSDLASMLVALTASREATAAAKKGDWDGVAKAGEQLRDDLQALRLRQEVAAKARFFINAHEPVQMEVPANSVVLPTDHLSLEQVEALLESWQRLRERPPVGPIFVANTEREALHELLRRGAQLVADGQPSPLAAEWLEQVRNVLDVEGT